MHDLAFAEEAEGIGDVGIVGKADEVIVGHARLLLRRLTFGKVGKRIALDSNVFHIKRHARCRDRLKVSKFIGTPMMEINTTTLEPMIYRGPGVVGVRLLVTKSTIIEIDRTIFYLVTPPKSLLYRNPFCICSIVIDGI